MDDEDKLYLLIDAPFSKGVWTFIEGLGPEITDRYWSSVEPRWGKYKIEDAVYATERLLRAGRPRAAFAFNRFERKDFPAKLVLQTMRDMAQSAEAPHTYQLEKYDIQNAFEHLNESGEISESDLANLEFLYLDVLDRLDDRIPNLEKQVSQDPSLFVQAIVFSFKRKDGLNDPDEFKSANDEIAKRKAEISYKFLDLLQCIPGKRDINGELDSQGIIDWVDSARARCAELSRLWPCDFTIGKLLAHAPKAESGAWPCAAVRDAIESLYTEALQKGITIEFINSRGAHWRGEGGDQERDLAAKYQGWESEVRLAHPNVARILRYMVEHYLKAAEWEDTEASVRKRLDH